MRVKNISKRAVQDLIVIAVITIIVFVLSYFFDAFLFLMRIFRDSPKAITYIDEIITVLLTLAISLAVFSWRRLKELKKESTERIKLQERLTMLANTKAETEGIINKQLASEIATRKNEERRYKRR